MFVLSPLKSTKKEHREHPAKPLVFSFMDERNTAWSVQQTFIGNDDRSCDNPSDNEFCETSLSACLQLSRAFPSKTNSWVELGQLWNGNSKDCFIQQPAAFILRHGPLQSSFTGRMACVLRFKISLGVSEVGLQLILVKFTEYLSSWSGLHLGAPSVLLKFNPMGMFL